LNTNRNEKANKLELPFANPSKNKNKYEVKENVIKGVYVSNLNEIDCPNPEAAYMCLL
jgi:hypothetical protein